MKFALIFLLPLFAQANTVASVFKDNSPLPRELKARILARVSQSCARGVIQYGLTEEYTKVLEDQVDFGVRDYTFTTLFRTTYYFDGMHPSFAYVTVVSEESSISNPSVDRFEIKSIKADAADICD